MYPGFIIFPWLCNHQYYLIPEHFHGARKKPHLLEVQAYLADVVVLLSDHNIRRISQ